MEFSQTRFVCLVVDNQPFWVVSCLPRCLSVDQVDRVSFRISEGDEVTTAGMVEQFFDSTGVRKL